MDFQVRIDSRRRALGLPEIPLNRPRFQWFRGAALGVALLVAGLGVNAPAADAGALDGGRHRVVVSTDIGGTDPDDFQSMVHLLLYADVLEIEGLISSPYGPGRLRDILTVIDHYERDFPQLSRSFSDYPSPDYLRDISKQGAIQRAPYSGVGQPTEGSDWIIACARRDDPRPLHILVNGRHSVGGLVAQRRSVRPFDRRLGRPLRSGLAATLSEIRPPDHA